jgi:hypothetical protein
VLLGEGARLALGEYDAAVVVNAGLEEAEVLLLILHMAEPSVAERAMGDPPEHRVIHG